MDWTGLLRDSWRVMRRSSALWGLGTISALQAGVYGVIVLGLILPMTVLTQLLVQLPAMQAAAPAAGGFDLAAVLPVAVVWLQRWGPLLVGGIVSIVAIWVVLGVLDVAATAGAIGQTTSLVEGRGASLRRGMRDGFAIWWRTVGLLAFAALPPLLYLLVVAAFTFLTISVPLAAGGAPDLAAMRAGNAINTMLSALVGLLGIPLAVLTQLGLRYAAIEHQEWKPALVSAWRLARANLAEVALMYLLQFGVTTGASLAFSMLFSFVLVIVGGAVFALVAAAQSFSGAAMFVTLLGGLAASGVALAFGAALFVWTSVVWTLFWRRLTGRDARSALPSTAPVGASETRPAQGEAT